MMAVKILLVVTIACGLLVLAKIIKELWRYIQLCFFQREISKELERREKLRKKWPDCCR